MRHIAIITILAFSSCTKCYQCKAVAGKGKSQAVVEYQLCGSKADIKAAEAAGTYGTAVTTCR